LLIPNYPSELPLGIANHLVEELDGFSLTLMHDVFMRIELPDHSMGAEDEGRHRLDFQHHHTLGLLYRLLQNNIMSLSEEVLLGYPNLQAKMNLPYYRFDELYHGKRISPNSNCPARFAYHGSNLTLDLNGVIAVFHNRKF